MPVHKFEFVLYTLQSINHHNWENTPNEFDKTRNDDGHSLRDSYVELDCRVTRNAASQKSNLDGIKLYRVKVGLLALFSNFKSTKIS